MVLFVLARADRLLGMVTLIDKTPDEVDNFGQMLGWDVLPCFKLPARLS
jgi:hypothetical protein